MLLSAVSVLVVAQSSSEIPEGLMNNPVCPSQSNCNTYYLASMKQRTQETVIITVYKLLLMFRKIIRASELISVKRCQMISLDETQFCHRKNYV